MIDARGLSCPQPVLMTKKAIDATHPGSLEVLLDNHTAVGNVKRLAAHEGYKVTVRELEDDEFALTLTK